MLNIQSVKVRGQGSIVTRLWESNVIAAGGGFENNSLAIANNLVRILQTKSYYSKIRYLLPMLGSGINAARVPLVDAINAGTATNTSFVNADFTQSLGLQGNGTSKIFNLNTTPISAVCGIGYWENNMSYTGTDSSPMGIGESGPDRRWYLDLRATLKNFSWGTYTNRAELATAALGGHYYGQSAATNDRKLYFNGSQIASNTTSDSATLTALNLRLMGWFYAGTTYYWAGRCGCAYITDGTFSAQEITDFHETLSNNLFAPTGRPTS
jgi:hypothetical protein